jgi:uncharacterized RDD family membrane protein YckC
MSRWTGAWLSGAESVSGRTPVDRFGLPEQGPGAPAGTGRRVVAYFVDALASALVAALFIPDPESAARGLLGVGVLAAEYVVLLSLTGQTFGMRLLGLRVLRLAHRDRPPGLQAALLRTALLVLLIPALLTDQDGRGLHDKAAGTVVVRAG